GSQILGVFDDADDSEPVGSLADLGIDAPSDGAVLPEAPRHRLIDDDYRLCLISHIHRLKGASFKRANPQGLEVILADDVPEIDVLGRPVRRWHVAFDLRVVSINGSDGRQLSGDGCRTNPRH